MEKIRKLVKKYNLKRVFLEAKRYFVYNIILFAAGLITTVFSYVYPVIDMYIIDKSISKKNYKLLILCLVVYLIVILLELLFQIVQTKVSVRVNSFIEMDLKKRVIGHFMNLKSGCFAQYDSGKIDTIIKNDLTEFRTIISNSLQDILLNLVQIFIVAFAMLKLNWKMGSIIIIFQLIDMFVFFKLNREMEELSVELRDSYIGQNRIMNDIIRYMRSLRLIGAKEYLFTRLDQAMKTKVRKTEKTEVASIRINSVGTVLMGIISCLIYLIGGYEIIYGTMTLGMLIGFMQYSSKFSSPVSSFCNSIAAYSQNIAQVREISNILEQLECNYKLRNQDKKLESIYIIKINQLKFRYSKGEPYIFDKTSAIFERNHIYFIVGKSGSGKSTLIRILMGQYEVERDMVLFNDMDIHHLPFVEEYINWFPQDPIILYDTIYNNITLGKKIPKEKLIKICKMCQIYDDIMVMEKGFDTMLEENGNNISGGQKQRIALARTLLDEKRIVILDEVTSAIDKQTEQLLKESIRQLAENKIVIIITHSQEFIMEEATVYEIKNQKIYKKSNLM